MKILFIDSTHQILAEMLTKNGFVCDFGYDYSLQKIYSELPKYQGIVIRSKVQITKEFIDKATQLKFIARVGAGMENIDTEYAKEKNIICFNSPEGNRDAVGEHAIGMLLMLFNNLERANREVKSGKWRREENRGFEIKGKTIGIIGYGNMGKSFAKKLSGFEVNVIAYDKYIRDFSDNFAKEVNLETLFKEADILSLHVPLTEETHYMIDNHFINNFKKDFYIINTARGSVVKTSDLVKNIKTTKIKAAALDVLEYEQTSFEDFFKQKIPADFEYLVKSENVLLSPHIAGWTHESNIKLSTVLVDKIVKKFKINK